MARGADRAGPVPSGRVRLRQVAFRRSPAVVPHLQEVIISTNQPRIRRVDPPSALLAITEVPRAIAEFATLASVAAPLLAISRRGDGHPVLVIPGLLAGDGSTAILRRYLVELGYDARPWTLGRNHGERTVGDTGHKLEAVLKSIYDSTGRPVSIVGWSLGGIMARLAGGRLPDLVRQVITLGSGFGGDPRATNAWRVYERASGRKVDDPSTRAMIEACAAAPAVPTTTIYSREDGVVAWQICRPVKGAPNSDEIVVRGSHIGLGVNASVLYAIADRLAQPQDGWAPFDRSGVRSLFYPAVAAA